MRCDICEKAAWHNRPLRFFKSMHCKEAMFAAKKLWQNKSVFYSHELQERADLEKQICAKILDALDHDGFCMVYQPKVDVKTLSISGFEALIRMKDLAFNPAQFIPLAKKTAGYGK